jgi:aspartate carbamoyltransferase regulatory subunit
MSLKDRTHLVVSAIKDGTVIDHIPAKDLFKVISILGLDHIDNQITFGTNLESKRLGKKSIIKISGMFFRNEDINKISLVAPEAKLNIIRDYIVVEKREVHIPDEITGIVKCVNPKCITNNETIKTKFAVTDKHNVKLKCFYCEKITDRNNMIINS